MSYAYMLSMYIYIYICVKDLRIQERPIYIFLYASPTASMLCTRPPTLSLASINTTRLDESLSFILCCDEVNGYVKLVDKKLKTHELFITYCFATAMPDTPAPTIIISADSSDE